MLAHQPNINAVLQWVQIHFWTQFTVLVLTFKALHDLGMGYPRNYLPHEQIHCMKSSKEATMSMQSYTALEW